MKPQPLFSFSFLILFLHSCMKTIAQSPTAAPTLAPPIAPAKPPPAPPAMTPAAQVPKTKGPINVAKILDSAGHFNVFARLMRATQADMELNTQLKNNGITIFAPTDGAFSGLKAGTLNTLSDGQKVELVKFHVVPQYISLSQFQTQSNPVRTQAGTGGRVSLNVTSEAGSVNITTGLTNTTVSGIVYDDNQLAIYQVDKVLLPFDIFTPMPPPAPAPAPTLETPAKKAPVANAESPVDEAAPKINNISGGVSLFLGNNAVMIVAVGVASAMLHVVLM